MKKSLFKHSKGISALFLIIAMLLMVTIGYVFSYLIPTKQKSVIFPIQSTQAFFIARSGVEFAVRYAVDNGWTTTGQLDAFLNGTWRSLGSGRFTLTYNYATYGDKLISVGEVPSASEKRRISVSNFISFLIHQLILSTPPDPCLRNSLTVEFYIKNQGTTNVTLNSFSASWTQTPPTRRISQISLNGVPKFNGNYANGSGQQNFNAGVPPTYTINAGQTIFVQVTFTNTISGLANMLVTFYSTPGDYYDFNLPPGGGLVPACP